MNLTWVDWLIVAVVLTVPGLLALAIRPYVRSVADYLVAARAAGSCTIAMASGMAWLGVVNVVAMLELFHTIGFSALWWAMLTTPAILYLSVSGFGVNRFRETRALTVAQFLEARYDKRVRVVAGIIAWTAGLLSFGLFPAVGARFFMAFCGLPTTFSWAGFDWSTFPLLMLLQIGLGLLLVFIGGHASLIVVECIQGVFTQVIALAIIVALFFFRLDWDRVVAVMMRMGSAANERSLLDPLHASNQPSGFTFWFFAVSAIGLWYTVLSNLQGHAFVASARTVRAYRIGAMLNQWRWQTLLLLFVMLVLSSMIVLYDPAQADTARQIHGQLDALTADQPTAVARETLRGQLVITLALSHSLPIGLAGLFCAFMSATMIGACGNALHAWGAVLLQDVALPFSKQPLATRTQLRLLRLSSLVVGGLALLLSWILPTSENLLMYFALTNNLWLGGSGAVILGGLYWRRGSRTAAFYTLIASALLGALGLLSTLGWPYWTGHKLPIDPQAIFLLTMLTTLTVYISLSLFGREKFDLERLLHRQPSDAASPAVPTVKWYDRLVFVSADFSRSERRVVYAVVVWFFAWLGFALVTMLIAGQTQPSEAAWGSFWRIYLYLLVALTVCATIGFTIGSVYDLRRLFQILRTQPSDFSDTGVSATGGSSTEFDGQPEHRVIPAASITPPCAAEKPLHHVL